MITETTIHKCIENGLGRINVLGEDPIELFDISGEIITPLYINEEDRFEDRESTLEIEASFDKELLLQDTALAELLFGKDPFSIEITQNELGSFWDIKVLSCAKLTIMDLTNGKVYFAIKNFKELSEIHY